MRRRRPVGLPRRPCPVRGRRAADARQAEAGAVGRDDGAKGGRQGRDHVRRVPRKDDRRADRHGRAEQRPEVGRVRRARARRPAGPLGLSGDGKVRRPQRPQGRRHVLGQADGDACNGRRRRKKAPVRGARRPHVLVHGRDRRGRDGGRCRRAAHARRPVDIRKRRAVPRPRRVRAHARRHTVGQEGRRLARRDRRVGHDGPARGARRADIRLARVGHWEGNVLDTVRQGGRVRVGVCRLPCAARRTTTRTGWPGTDRSERARTTPAAYSAASRRACP